MRTEYVLGLIFNEEMTHLVLVHKKRPAWQKGKWNGVGGKIEPFEAALDAMVRECKEETDLNIQSWTRYARLLDGSEAVVHCFYTALPPYDICAPKMMTDEEVLYLPINVNMAIMVPYVPTLVQLAIEHKTHRFTTMADIAVLPGINKGGVNSRE